MFPRNSEIVANQTFYLPMLSALEKIFSFVDARNTEQELQAGLFRRVTLQGQRGFL